MEEASSSDILEAEIVGISFALATHRQIRLASISDAGINHASQLSNAFLGLPLEFGKCEACGATEPDKCEGHFGYIHLPVPIYHPAHVSELKQMLSLLCLKCLKIKKIKSTSSGLAERLLGVCCEEASNITIKDKSSDGASYLQLKLPSRTRLQEGFWNFLERYGYRYGSDHTRPLLAREVKEILRRIPEETRKKLTAKGHIPQEGYILEYLPVPPNCLSVPEVSDGSNSMSVDPSRIELKDVLRKVVAINNSRSGETNFESHRAEANEMFRVVDTYLQVRGTAKPTRRKKRRSVRSESATPVDTGLYMSPESPTGIPPPPSPPSPVDAQLLKPMAMPSPAEMSSVEEDPTAFLSLSLSLPGADVRQELKPHNSLLFPRFGSQMKINVEERGEALVGHKAEFLTVVQEMIKVEVRSYMAEMQKKIAVVAVVNSSSEVSMMPATAVSGIVG